MNSKIPPPHKKTLEEIFQDVEKGYCAIPDFQRYWTWTKKQVEELWESIFQEYYIGSILIWKPSEYKLGRTATTGGPTPIDDPYLMLDGQQRTTGIYYAVRAPDIPMPNTDMPYKFFLNIEALLDPSADSSEIIYSYNEKNVEKKGLDKIETQFNQRFFPLTYFQDRNYSKWLFDFYEYLQKEGFTKEKAQEYYNKLNEIFSYIWSSYEIPVVELPNSLPLDNVAAIFERINSKGTPLGVFDLLNARFIIYGIVLKEQWERTKNNHENIKKWHDDFNNEKVPLYIIQSISLLKSGNINRKSILNLDKLYKNSETFQSETFLTDWDDMSRYVEQTIRRLTSTGDEGFGAINYNFIPNTVMVPILAVLLKNIEDRTNRPDCLVKIQCWYWSLMYSGGYATSTASDIESDFKKLEKWFNDDTTNPFKIYEQNDLDTHVRSSSTYKAIMCLIAKKGALDFIRGDPPQYSTLEDHHIFPRSKAEKYKAGDKINSVLNRTLISDITNRFLGNKDPSVYLEEIMNKQKITKEELQERLETHLISEKAFEYMLNDDFEKFIQEREGTIRDEFRKLLEKCLGK